MASSRPLAAAFGLIWISISPCAVAAQGTAGASQPPDRPDCLDPQASGPAFKSIRYQEEFCNREATSADPWWFSLKNIELGSVSLSVGGEVRTRFDHYSPVDAGLHDGVDDSYVTYRGLVHADMHAGEHWRVFGQIGYWNSEGREPEPAGTDVDHGDVQQLFVEWHRDAAFARLGRQETLYGSGRLIGLRQAPNIRRTFDGARIGIPVAGGGLDLFYLRPVEIDPEGWNNREDAGELVAGLYYARKPDGDRLGFDAYAFRFERAFQDYQNASGAEGRNVFGGRLFGSLQRFTLNSELTFQGGRAGDESVRAWSWQNDVSFKTTDQSPWSLGLKANAASGDSDRSDGRLETFQPIYAAPPYFMQSALIAAANLANIQPYVEWEAGPTVTLTVELQADWRMETADGFYQPPLEPQSLDERGHFIGSQAGVSIRWAAKKELLVEAWTSRFFTDGPLERAGARDTTFFALMVTASF